MFDDEDPFVITKTIPLLASAQPEGYVLNAEDCDDDDDDISLMLMKYVEMLQTTIVTR